MLYDKRADGWADDGRAGKYPRQIGLHLDAFQGWVGIADDGEANGHDGAGADALNGAENHQPQHGGREAAQNTADEKQSQAEKHRTRLRP